MADALRRFPDPEEIEALRAMLRFLSDRPAPVSPEELWAALEGWRMRRELTT